MSTSLKLLIAGIIVGVLLWLVTSVNDALAPFVAGAVIAYIVAPLADRLEARNMPPTAVAIGIVIVLSAFFLLLLFSLFPVIAAQLRELMLLLPPLIEKVQTWLGEDLAQLLSADNVDLKAIGVDGAGKAANFFAALFGSGLAFLTTFLTTLLITPLAIFYFLRDRRRIGGELTEILPPNLRDRALRLISDLNGVLGEFLHAQLLVMLIMAVFYALLLTLAGLEYALTIGVLSGLLVFIPYVGFALGLVLATLVGLGNFSSWFDIFILWGLMGIGSAIESVVITPRLVGERIGLHPLAVLLALMVFGEWFGFIGLLMSLPLAAVCLVCCRHLRRHYIGSEFYRRR